MCISHIIKCMCICVKPYICRSLFLNMGRIDFNLDDNFEDKFRKEVYKRKGMKKGNITEALTEAIEFWIKEKQNE